MRDLGDSSNSEKDLKDIILKLNLQLVFSGVRYYKILQPPD